MQRIASTEACVVCSDAEVHTGEVEAGVHGESELWREGASDCGFLPT